MKRLLLNFVFLFASLAAFAAGVQESIFKFASDSTLRAASLGISVVRISDCVEIAGCNSRIAQIPASTMKSLTSATALAVLGSDFTFKTEVKLVGKLKKNRLEGSIVVCGGCDPTLGSKYIEGQPDIIVEIVDALKARGIRKVKGAILFSPDESTVMSIVPTWMMEDLPLDYGAGVYPFNYKDNAFDLSIEMADAEVLGTKAVPADVDFDVVNHCVLADSTDVFATSYPEIMRFPEDRYFHIYGNMLPGTRTLSFNCSMPSPQSYFIRSLEKALRKADIDYDYNEDSALDNTDDSTLLLTHQSVPLPEIVRSLLYRSDNMFTQALLMTVGHHFCGSYNATEGIKAVYRFWKDAGLDVTALWMKDGSGLSRNNKVSAEFLSKMLALSQSGTIGDVNFAALFPRLGVDGTVKRFMGGTPFAGKIYMKSGSMGEVQCYTGYFPADEPQYTITFLVNNFGCSRSELHSKLESMLLSLLPALQ